VRARMRPGIWHGAQKKLYQMRTCASKRKTAADLLRFRAFIVDMPATLDYYDQDYTF